MKIKLPTKSLAFRLAVLYGSLFLVATGLVFAVVHLILAHKLLQNLDQDLKEDVSEITTIYLRKGLPALKSLASAELAEEGPNNFFFRILDSEGREVFSVGNSVFKTLPWPDRASESPKFFVFDLTDSLGRVRAVVWRLGKHRMEMAVPLRFNQRILAQIHRAFLWAGAVALLISFPMGFLFAKRSLRQILEIERVARGIVDARDFSRRVPLSGRGDEPDRLAETFNSMLEKLDLYFRELLQIFDNLAHDFKNLLSHLRLLAERALEKRDPEEREELIVRILYESDRFLHLLNVLLDLSEAETGLLKLRRERFPVKDILEEVDQVFRELAVSQGLNFEIRYPDEDLYLFADRARLLQALLNLVDNAFKYTPSGGRIQVEAKRKGEDLVIKVQDSGRGISPEELSRIFDRFYRGRGPERGRGLGLSLARAYVEAHGGEISVESEPGRGSVFYIVLPQTLPVETTHPTKEIVED